jgi:ElaB/YqjD/DUF883 family membrane-anchored ribosome-binding protein
MSYDTSYESQPPVPNGDAAAKAKETAQEAATQVREVVSEAKEQAKEVAVELKAQAHELLDRTQSGLRDEAQARTERAAQSLRTLSTQVTALRDGHPDQAGPLLNYVDQAQQRLTSYADGLQQRGFQGVIDDVTQFARRRPALFLASCAGAGFMLARMAKSQSAAPTAGASSSPRSTAAYRPATAQLPPPAWDEPPTTGTGQYGMATASGAAGGQVRP